MDSVDEPVWALGFPGQPDTLLTIADAGPNLLAVGYIIRAPMTDFALALGHVQQQRRLPTVRFATARIRWREEAAVTAAPVSDGLWVAEAAGEFDLVIVNDSEEESGHVARLQLLI